MLITLEEAKTLDTFARLGSIAKTAQALRKANSAVVYSLGSIETKTDLKILDRSGYRTTLRPAGLRVLEACRKMLAASSELETLCVELSSGWESDLRIIVEGVVPLSPIFESIKAISQREIPTRIHVAAEFLSAVENTFIESGADLMISVLPPRSTDLDSVNLPEVAAVLVAHQRHPLVSSEKKIGIETLKRYPVLTVRGSDPRLNLPTASLDSVSTLQLNDFHSKKTALMSGLGYGWMPRYLIEGELKRGLLKTVRWTGPSIHVFKPCLYHHGQGRLGKAGRAFIERLSRG